MQRKIVKIDEDKCDGCGNCVPGCAEGALQIIDRKARLISDLFCDGLGACLGNCPQNAITIEEREAEPYNEYKVMDYIVKGGPNVIKAHLMHLKDHNEMIYLQQAVEYLQKKNIVLSFNGSVPPAEQHHAGCPGSAQKSFSPKTESEESGKRTSRLRQWPVQLHLISPLAGHFNNSDLLLTADCAAYAYADFHKDYLANHSIAIACPKLDTNKEVYLDKLISMINDNNLQSITVLIMQVPCCSGLLQLAQQAIHAADREIPLRAIVIGIEGDILKDINLN